MSFVSDSAANRSRLSNRCRAVEEEGDAKREYMNEDLAFARRGSACLKSGGKAGRKVKRVLSAETGAAHGPAGCPLPAQRTKLHGGIGCLVKRALGGDEHITDGTYVSRRDRPSTTPSSMVFHRLSVAN